MPHVLQSNKKYVRQKRAQIRLVNYIYKILYNPINFSMFLYYSSIYIYKYTLAQVYRPGLKVHGFVNLFGHALDVRKEDGSS